MKLCDGFLMYIRFEKWK